MLFNPLTRYFIVAEVEDELSVDLRSTSSIGSDAQRLRGNGAVSAISQLEDDGEATDEEIPPAVTTPGTAVSQQSRRRGRPPKSSKATPGSTNSALSRFSDISIGQNDSTLPLEDDFDDDNESEESAVKPSRGGRGSRLSVQSVDSITGELETTSTRSIPKKGTPSPAVPAAEKKLSNATKSPAVRAGAEGRAGFASIEIESVKPKPAIDKAGATGKSIVKEKEVEKEKPSLSRTGKSAPTTAAPVSSVLPPLPASYDADSGFDDAGFQDDYDQFEDNQASNELPAPLPSSASVSVPTPKSSLKTAKAKVAAGNQQRPQAQTQPRRVSFDQQQVTPAAPGSSKSLSSGIPTPGSNDFPRGRVLADDSYQQDSEDEDEGVGVTSSARRRSSLSSEGTDEADDSFASETSYFESLQNRHKRKSGAGMTDEESGSDASEEAEDEEADDGRVRRSRRATKGQRFAFWKNERPVYDGGDMVGLLMALPTPDKKRGQQAQGQKTMLVAAAARKRSRGKKRMFSDEEMELPPVVLPVNVAYLDRADPSSQKLQVWDEPTTSIVSVKAVSHRDKLGKLMPLPPTEESADKDGKLSKKARVQGFAAQTFSLPEISGVMPGWISGFIELPPGAVKDAEGVGECAQVFAVSDCQEQSLEMALADPVEADWNEAIAQRQLLSKGDSFFVAPGNIYRYDDCELNDMVVDLCVCISVCRLENHSTVKTAVITWVIIKPMATVAAGAAGAAK